MLVITDDGYGHHASLLQGDGVLTQEYDQIVAFVRRQRRESTMKAVTSRRSAAAPIDTAETPPPDQDRVRQRLEAELALHEVTAGCLESWEQTAAGHGRAARFRPPNTLLSDLLADIEDLQLLLGSRHTAMTLRHTTRLIAQMAGLLSLTLLKLNDLPHRESGRAPLAPRRPRPRTLPPAPGSGPRMRTGISTRAITPELSPWRGTRSSSPDERRPSEEPSQQPWRPAPMLRSRIIATPPPQSLPRRLC